ncbi:MAG: penicillin-binding protein 2 [Cyanophyceae cyanobacterium]
MDFNGADELRRRRDRRRDNPPPPPSDRVRRVLGALEVPPSLGTPGEPRPSAQGDAPDLEAFDISRYRDRDQGGGTSPPRSGRSRPTARQSRSWSQRAQALQGLRWPQRIPSLRSTPGWDWGDLWHRLPPIDQVNPSRRRVWAVAALLGLGLVGLGVRLTVLQLAQGKELTARARASQRVSVTPFVPRRAIVDRNGTVLALDRLTYVLYAHPKLFLTSADAIAEALAPVLGESPAALWQKLRSGRSGIRLRQRLPEDLAARVRALNLNGLELLPEPSRIYPQQDLAAEVVGYTDFDGQGQAGLERRWHKILDRRVDPIVLERAPEGLTLPAESLEPTQAGDRDNRLTYADGLQLRLTLDSRVQRAARAALEDQFKAFKPKRGAIIAMEVRTGAIVALACAPSYDPNRYYEADIAAFKNWAVSDLYEPGSTFKPITVALGLDLGAIAPDEPFNDPGFIRVGDRTITNYRYPAIPGPGRIDLATALKKSSNVAMVRIMQKMNPEEYYNRLKQLGIDRLPGSDLPQETAGQLRSRDAFISSPIDRATTSFGQGLSLTPLKLIQAIAAIGNGGQLVTPHTIDALAAPDGDRYWQPYRPAPERVFSPETSQTVLAMMEGVLDDGGTGTRARIPGYRIAGKTGTSQKISDRGGYLPGASIASFVGLLPAEAPRYAILAIFDEPQGGSGGLVAAPAAKTVMEALIAVDRIPPSSNPSAPPNDNP